MNNVERFQKEVAENIARQGANKSLKKKTLKYVEALDKKYTYNFSWMGRPIIQFPQDIVAMQEIIWQVRPELIIETGIAHGGSLIFYASMLELLGGNGQVLGIDVDIRPDNLAEIIHHPMYKRIAMIEASCLEEATVRRVCEVAKGKSPVLLCLDSNHTHDHVLRELELYAPLVSVGSYCVVFDTLVDDLPPALFTGKPWGPGNSPKSAVRAFLKHNKCFEPDVAMDNKLLLTGAIGGFLKRIR